jgi:hypothetical protein
MDLVEQTPASPLREFFERESKLRQLFSEKYPEEAIKQLIEKSKKGLLTWEEAVVLATFEASLLSENPELVNLGEDFFQLYRLFRVAELSLGIRRGGNTFIIASNEKARVYEQAFFMKPPPEPDNKKRGKLSKSRLSEKTLLEGEVFILSRQQIILPPSKPNVSSVIISVDNLPEEPIDTILRKIKLDRLIYPRMVYSNGIVFIDNPDSAEMRLSFKLKDRDLGRERNQFSQNFPTVTDKLLFGREKVII